MKRPPAGAAAAKRRRERAEAASEGLAVILGDAVGAITARAVKEMKVRAMAAAPPAVVASGAEFGIEDLPMPPGVTIGPDGLPMPAISWQGLFDELVWSQALDDATEFIASFVSGEMDAEFGLDLAKEQPLVQGITAQHVAEIEAWGDEFKSMVGRVVDRGHREVMSVPQVAKALQQAGVDSERRAKLIARTETIGASNGASYKGALAIASPGDRKRWMATSDSRTRDWHRDADGQEVPLDQPFIVGGERGDYPGSGSGWSAKNRANCRCTFRVVYGEGPAVLEAPVEPATPKQPGASFKEPLPNGVERIYDLDHITDPAVKEAAERELSALAERFPVVANRVTRVGSYKATGVRRDGPLGESGRAVNINTAGGTVKGGSISVGDTRAPEIIKAFNENQLSTPHPAHLWVHEFAHHVAYAYEDAYKGAVTAGKLDYPFASMAQATQDSPYLRLSVIDAVEGFAKTKGWGSKTRAAVSKEISNYGASVPTEAFPEAFADYWFNGSGASPMSRAIVEPVLELIEKHAPNYLAKVAVT